jgi:hypothetical protein
VEKQVVDLILMNILLIGRIPAKKLLVEGMDVKIKAFKLTIKISTLREDKNPVWYWSFFDCKHRVSVAKVARRLVIFPLAIYCSCLILLLLTC